MSLPAFELPTEELVIGGHTITVRCLTRGEALKVAEQGGEDIQTIEVLVIATLFDVSVDDARAWYDSTPADVTKTILEAVNRLSGLDGLGKDSSGA